tara:strand:+ start:124 stop:525 length:402 start_codon:yes stop_codon:yes gene_type:complete
MAHNFITGQFTQAECDTYNEQIVRCQTKLDLLNNVSGTYPIQPVTGIDENGTSIVSNDTVDMVLSAGLSTFLSDWRAANPTADGTSGTDIEKGEYARWYYWTNTDDYALHITTHEEDLAELQACHAEMLATVE